MSSTLALALFDTGEFHSLISEKLVRCLSLSCIALVEPVKVGSPVGGQVAILQLCEDCGLILGDVELKFDFLVMPLEGYDLIIGMDWLSAF